MSPQSKADKNPPTQNEHGIGQPHANEMNEPIPHIGQPLDGRHYLDVLEEQTHAEQKPDLDGENPRHPDMDNENK